MVEKLKVGEVINKLRKEKGLTQEQLAKFVGVSTPAVSKWESNTSYPDITLLPTLAKLFSVTIDELLNYNITLSEAEEEEIIIKCQNILNENKENAVEECKKYIKKYPSNYKMKLHIANLINMLYGINNEKEYTKAYKETMSIFEEIVENCRDREVVEMAILMLGTGYRILKDYDKALEMFEKIQKPICDIDLLIGSVYIEQGRERDGRRILQQRLISKINELQSIIGTIGNTYSKENTETAKKYVELLVEIDNTLKKQGFPDLLLNGALHLANIYAVNNDVEECIS